MAIAIAMFSAKSVLFRHLMTPVMYAAQNGRPNLVKMLIENQADMNIQDTRGWTVSSFLYLVLSINFIFLPCIGNRNEFNIDFNKCTPRQAFLVLIFYSYFFLYFLRSSVEIRNDSCINRETSNKKYYARKGFLLVFVVIIKGTSISKGVLLWSPDIKPCLYRFP